MKHNTLRSTILSATMALVVSSVLAGCSDQSDGTVRLVYHLQNKQTGQAIDCQTAGVAQIQFLFYGSAESTPIERTASCNATADGPGTASVQVPAQTYEEIAVHMLRDDQGPSCLSNLSKATWVFRNSDQGAKVPAGGSTLLQDLTAEFYPDSLPECGNGVREACEDCDDGNRTSGDGCSASCEVEQAAQQ